MIYQEYGQLWALSDLERTREWAHDVSWYFLKAPFFKANIERDEFDWARGEGEEVTFKDWL